MSITVTARLSGTEQLGAPEQWPAALRTALAICSASPQAMQVWYGPGLVLVYNDATRGLLAERCTRPALAAAIGPAVERVRRDGQLVGEVAASILDRAYKFTLAPLLGDAGEVLGVVTTCASGGAELDKDQLLALLAHELRNELSPLAMTVGMMKLRGETPELGTLELQLRRVRRLVDDVVDASRLARGKVVLERSRVEVAQVIGPAIDAVTPMFEHHGSRIAVDAAPGVHLVADPARLVQALTGLLLHAASHREGGGRIAIAVAQHGDRMQISITDDAGALPASTELSFAIARGIVDLHRGRIEVRGRTIAIELPAEIAAAEPSAVVPAPSAGPLPAAARSAKRILIVEDNDETARSLQAALEQLGYVVALAHDGPVALSVARTFDPDVALLDIALPVMDGYELARRLRALRGSPPELRVVAVTGTSDPERSSTEGFAQHLGKPVDFETLERVVDQLAAAANDSG